MISNKFDTLMQGKISKADKVCRTGNITKATSNNSPRPNGGTQVGEVAECEIVPEDRVLHT